MPCKIKNPANIDLKHLEPKVQSMYDHFNQKFSFQKPPVMLFDSDKGNESNILGKTAYYDPSSLEIHVFTDGRHPKDMLRSIAHELIHHHQNMEDRLDVGGYMGEGYYLENKAMKLLEQEAMLEGNATMREWEDTVKREEKNTMSLKEWKNNELNQQLLKKFGILKEEKKNMVKDPKTGKMVPDYAVDGKGDKDLKEEKCEKCHPEPCKCESMEESKDIDDNKKKYKNTPKFDNDTKPPQGAPGVVSDEDEKEATLQESIRRIAKARKITFRNKRVK